MGLRRIARRPTRRRPLSAPARSAVSLLPRLRPVPSSARSRLRRRRRRRGLSRLRLLLRGRRRLHAARSVPSTSSVSVPVRRSPPRLAKPRRPRRPRLVSSAPRSRSTSAVSVPIRPPRSAPRLRRMASVPASVVARSSPPSLLQPAALPHAKVRPSSWVHGVVLPSLLWLPSSAALGRGPLPIQLWRQCEHSLLGPLGEVGLERRHLRHLRLG